MAKFCSNCGAELNEEEKKIFEKYQDRFPDDCVHILEDNK